MTTFRLFFEELLALVQKYEKQQVMIKVEEDLDHEFVKILVKRLILYLGLKLVLMTYQS